MALEGLQQVMNNLNQAITQIMGQTAAGLYEAGLLVMRRSMGRTPVDTGALRASARTDQDEEDGNPIVVVSYHQDYGIYVHENLEARHPNGEAKFLEHAVSESTDDILAIVANRARV